jgi:hypothetical protein
MRRPTAVATSPACTSGLRVDGVPGIGGVQGLPGVLVADAEARQRLPGRVRGGVEVPEDDDVVGAAGQPLEQVGGGRRQLLALVLVAELPARLVVGEQGPADGGVDLDDERCAPGEAARPVGAALVDLLDDSLRRPSWPAPRRRRRRPPGGTASRCSRARGAPPPCRPRRAPPATSASQAAQRRRGVRWAQSGLAGPSTVMVRTRRDATTHGVRCAGAAAARPPSPPRVLPHRPP